MSRGAIEPPQLPLQCSTAGNKKCTVLSMQGEELEISMSLGMCETFWLVTGRWPPYMNLIELWEYACNTTSI